MAVMLITHAMGVVAETAQRVVVMYAGKVVEEAPVERAVRQPAPPLHPGPDPLDPAPRHGGGDRRRGWRPSPAPCRACSPRRPAAASPRAAASCSDRVHRRPSRRCARWRRATRWRASCRRPARGRRPMTEPLLQRRQDLVKRFPVRGGLLAARGGPCPCGRRRQLRPRARARRWGWSANPAAASRTTGRCILRLIEPTSGEVLFEGRDVTALNGAELARAPRATCRSSSRTPTPR